MPIFPYEYNYRSLLCRVKLKSDNSTVATYKHDALGRRVEKEVGSPRERYIYSGFETVSVYDSTNTWVRDFVFGQGIDEVLMLRQADVTDFDGDTDTGEVTRHFYHRNALGSVMMLTDMNEAEGVSYRYDPYGAVTITVGGTPQSDDPLGNPFMFTARFQDEETGLMYYRARHYAPATGRFLQRDPEGYGQGASLFEYAGSHPTIATDPTGRWWWLIPLVFLSGCGDTTPGTKTCVCEITCKSQMDASPTAVYATDFQVRELGACTSGGDPACQRKCEKEARAATAEANNQLSDESELADMTAFGAQFVRTPITNPQTGDTDWHRVPQRSTWWCASVGECRR